MKLSEIRYGEHFKCRIEAYSEKSSATFELKPGNRISTGEISKDERIDNAYILNMNDERKMVKITKCDDLPAFENRFSSKLPALFEIVDKLSNDSFDIEVVFFSGIKNIEKELVINLTDDLLDKENPISAKKSGIRGKTLAEIGNSLASEFALGPKERPYYLFVGSSATVNSFTNEIAEIGDFSLVSKTRQLLVKSSKNKDETLLFARGVKNRTPRNFDNSVCLLRGKIKFNEKGTEAISRINALEIENDLKDGSSYIGKWDEYNNLIGERLFKSARKIGYAVVSGEPNMKDTHTIRFHFSENDNKGKFAELSEDIDINRLDIVQELPPYLTDPNLTYDEWIAKEVDSKLSQEEYQKKLSKEEKEKAKEAKDWSNLEIESVGPDFVDVKRNRNVKAGTFPKRGEDGKLFIILSISGDKIQVERRRRARQNIVQGKSQISGLGLILDGKEAFSSPEISRGKKKCL